MIWKYRDRQVAEASDSGGEKPQSRNYRIPQCRPLRHHEAGGFPHAVAKKPTAVVKTVSHIKGRIFSYRFKNRPDTPQLPRAPQLHHALPVKSPRLQMPSWSRSKSCTMSCSREIAWTTEIDCGPPRGRFLVSRYGPRTDPCVCEPKMHNPEPRQKPSDAFCSMSTMSCLYHALPNNPRCLDRTLPPSSVSRPTDRACSMV